jgi:hypothetical protein
MPIYRTTKHSLSFTDTTGPDISLSATAQIPTGTIPGVNVGGDVGLVFKRSVSRFWEFEKLETFIIRPTKPYVKDSLDDGGGPVSKYLDRHRVLAGKSGSWTLYMISGIVIARGAKSGKIEDSKETGGNVGGKASALAVGEVGASVDIGNKKSVTVEFGGVSDFVWALKLTKVSKNLFGKDWEMETVSKGATYSLGKEEEGKVRVEDVLEEEGSGVGKEATVFKVGEDEIFVIPEEGDETG